MFSVKLIIIYIYGKLFAMMMTYWYKLDDSLTTGHMTDMFD